MLREQYWGGRSAGCNNYGLTKSEQRTILGGAGQPFATTPVNSKSTVFGCCFLDIFVENRQNFLRSRLRRSRFYLYIFWWEGRAQKQRVREAVRLALYSFSVCDSLFGDIFKGFRLFVFPKTSKSFFVKGMGCCFWDRGLSKRKVFGRCGVCIQGGFKPTILHRKFSVRKERPSRTQNPLYFLEN